jgi:hypothetical protein
VARAWRRPSGAEAIDLQIAATPQRVGRPIDVLEIGADGRATWMDRDKGSACAAIP